MRRVTGGKITRYNIGSREKPNYRFVSVAFCYNKHGSLITQTIKPKNGILQLDKVHSDSFSKYGQLLNIVTPVPYYNITEEATTNPLLVLDTQSKIKTNRYDKDECRELAFGLAGLCFYDICHPDSETYLRQIIDNRFPYEALVELSWMDYTMYGTKNVVERRLSRFISMYNLLTGFNLLEFKNIGQEISSDMNDTDMSLLTNDIVEQISLGLRRRNM